MPTNKTNTAKQKEKPPKPKYNMWQSSWYMIRLAVQEKEKKVLILCTLTALLAVASNLANLSITPVILGAVEVLNQSASAFERWCDNRLIEKIQPQKYETTTVAPLAAWLLARENEIKTVRILLSGKRNGLSDDAIRERLREMYV